MDDKLLSSAARRLSELLGKVPPGPFHISLSGGADSVFLLRAAGLLPAAERSVARAFHVDHGLSRLSGEWAAMCAAMCAGAGVPLTVANVADDLRDRISHGACVEEAARDARLHAASAAGVSTLVLGHHADDQAETVLFRIARGTGVRGLAGMRPVSSVNGIRLLRPLLGIRGSDIRASCLAAGVDVATDPSNSDDTFSRNMLRLRVLPVINEKFPSFVGGVSRVAELAAEAADIISEVAAEDLAACSTSDGLLDARLMAGLSPARLRNLLASMPSMLGMHPSPSSAQVAAAARAVSGDDLSRAEIPLGGLLLSGASGFLLSALPRKHLKKSAARPPSA